MKSINITSTDQIAGLPAFRIRFALKAAGGTKFIWPICADHFCVSEGEAKTICDQLVVEGYIKVEDDHGVLLFYSVTSKGRKLLKSAIPDPLTKAEAMQLLTDVIEHLQIRAEHSDTPYQIRAVQLIGEVLTNAHVLPHLEIAITPIRQSIKERADVISEEEMRQYQTMFAQEMTEISPSICVRSNAVVPFISKEQSNNKRTSDQNM